MWSKHQEYQELIETIPLMTTAVFWSRKTTSLLGILFSEKYVALKRYFYRCKKYLCMVKARRGKPKLAVQNVYVFDGVNCAWTSAFFCHSGVSVVFRWQT